MVQPSLQEEGAQAHSGEIPQAPGEAAPHGAAGQDPKGGAPGSPVPAPGQGRGNWACHG